MVDMHSHILFDVDDGSKSLMQSIEILKEAEQAGFTDVFFTPHYLAGFYETSQEELNRKLNLLKEELNRENVNINIYLGSEIYTFPEINKKVVSKSINSMNNSKYVLIETPLTTRILYFDNEIDELIKNGYIPILAHPERYTYIHNNIEFLKPLIEKGVLLQANYGSIIGKYGYSAKKTVKQLLKNKWITFMGSDVHHSNGIYTEMPAVLKKLNRMVDQEYFEKITERNAKELNILVPATEVRP